MVKVKWVSTMKSVKAIRISLKVNFPEGYIQAKK